MPNRTTEEDVMPYRRTEENTVPNGPLTRGQMLKLSGAVAAAGLVGARVPDALATPRSNPSGPVDVGVVDRSAGRSVDVVSDSGEAASGQSPGVRPLQHGERVVLQTNLDGSPPTVTPLYVNVEGRVTAVSEHKLSLNGATYVLDAFSRVRAQQGDGWIDLGPVGANVQPGMAVGALCVAHPATTDVTVDVAFIL